MLQFAGGSTIGKEANLDQIPSFNKLEEEDLLSIIWIDPFWPIDGGIELRIDVAFDFKITHLELQEMENGLL